MLTASVYDTHVEQLFDRIQQLHHLLTEAGVPYRIVGGMAVFILETAVDAWIRAY